MPPGHPTNHQSPVQRGQHVVGQCARLLYAAQRPAASAAYSAARQPLAGNVPQVQPNAAVRQFEIIQVIAADGGEGLQFARDGHRAGAQRFRWHHHALDRASFFELVFPKFFDGLQFVWRCGRVHSSVRAGSATPREKCDGSQNSNRAAAMQGENGGVVSWCNSPRDLLAARHGPRHNFFMRFLFGVLVGAAIFFAVYHFYLKRMPATDDGTAATQAISLTGVENDLIGIGQAERMYFAQNGSYADLTTLTSSGTMNIARNGRDGYTYAVETSATGFTATARYTAQLPQMPPGVTPPRFPTVTIDQTMEVHQSD